MTQTVVRFSICFVVNFQLFLNNSNHIHYRTVYKGIVSPEIEFRRGKVFLGLKIYDTTNFPIELHFHSLVSYTLHIDNLYQLPFPHNPQQVILGKETVSQYFRVLFFEQKKIFGSLTYNSERFLKRL
jgi:hypothetical protein